MEPQDFRIRRAVYADHFALTTVLLDCVDSGASVGFLAPLSREKATDFWRGVLDSMTIGSRIVLVAETASSGQVVGTVQIVLDTPENQPHRAEIAKMLVHRVARRRGIGAALLLAAEAVAREANRTLLVLDTATGSEAERLYTRLGWQRCGIIPNYAQLPHGGLWSTSLFYRELSCPHPSESEGELVQSFRM